MEHQFSFYDSISFSVYLGKAGRIAFQDFFSWLSIVPMFLIVFDNYFSKENKFKGTFFLTSMLTK